MRIAVTAAVVLFSTGALAQVGNSPASRQAYSDLAHEKIVCTAYFGTAAKCFGSRPEDKALAQQAMKDFVRSLQTINSASEKAGLKKETAMARLGMATDDMTTAIDGDCGNISILPDRHAMLCKRLLEEPAERFKELLADALRPRAD